jgi:hypothetical protein
MFDFIQHLKSHKPAPILPCDFSSEYDESEFLGLSLGDDEAYDRYAFVNPENAGTKTLPQLGGHFSKQVVVPDEQRFLKGSHTKTRLATALAAMGNEGLLKTTLLWPEVSKEHANELFLRFCRKAEKIDVREAGKAAKELSRNGRPYRRGEKRIKPFSTYQSFKFLTILHKVVHLCDGEAVNSVKQMMYQVNECFSRVSGVSCLGAAECEIISRRLMRKIRQLTIDGKKSQIDFNGGYISVERKETIDKNIEAQEFRKLNVCEGLSLDNNASLYANDASELLIHFHGIVCSPSQTKFDEILDVLKSNPMWQKQPWQIELKCLTKKYGKKVKSVVDNFRDISDYIVKGGNDWVGKKAYLRYKLRFCNDMPLSDDEIDNINWRTDELLRQDRKDHGRVKDLLSLSISEINILSKTINTMMNLKPNGKGHIFCCGHW